MDREKIRDKLYDGVYGALVANSGTDELIEEIMPTLLDLFKEAEESARRDERERVVKEMRGYVREYGFRIELKDGSFNGLKETMLHSFLDSLIKSPTEPKPEAVANKDKFYPEENIAVCGICGKQFDTMSDLQCHKTKRHKAKTQPTPELPSEIDLALYKNEDFDIASQLNQIIRHLKAKENGE